MDLTLPSEDPVLEFTVLVVVVLAVQLAFRRLPVPALVGLLIAGMLIGPEAAAILTPDAVVGLLGSIGLLYIMFLAGLEIDLDIVRHHKREAATFGGLGLALTFVPALGLGLLFGVEWAGAVLLAAAIPSHTLIAYPMLESMGLLHRRPIVAAVGGTLLTDTAALIVLIVVIQLAREDGGALGWLWPILSFAAISVLALVLVPKLSRFIFDRLKTGTAESALYALGVLVALAALAELVGAEDILGAFLAGLCLNRVLAKREVLLEHLVFAGRMLFIPFFFIETGMQLRLDVFAELQVWVLAAAMVAVILGGKGAAAWISGHLFDYGRAGRLTMFGLTIPQAAATLAVTTIAVDSGLMDDETLDAVIIVIFVTCLAGALIVRGGGRRLAQREDDR